MAGSGAKKEILDTLSMELMKSHCIKECAEWILSNKYSQVGLEFPDSLHNDSVSHLLQEEIGFSPIVFKEDDKACGDCCVDETSTPRKIEAVIHFGNTCLTPTILLPVLYVLNSSITFDSEKLKELLLNSQDGPKKEDNIILLYNVCCTPFISLFYENLKSHFPNLILSTLVIHEKAKLMFHHEPNNVNIENLNINEINEKSIVINNRKLNLPLHKDLNDYNFIYIGSKGPTLQSFQMRFSDKSFYVLDRIDNTFTTSNLTKTVMGRSAKIEQVRDAKVIGILLTYIYKFEEIEKRMKKLIKMANKIHYTFGIKKKVTEAKLGNFIGADVYVCVSCPENSLYDRMKDKYLYKQIVTPWELEVALNPSFKWTLNFVTNFNELLDVEIEETEETLNEENSPKERNHFETREKNDSEIMVRNPGTLYKLHENAGGAVVQSLSWKGLNPSEESSVPIGTVVKGRKGIAIRYDSEVQ